LRDPEPALLRGNTIARRLHDATKRAISILGEQARQLEGLDARPAVLRSLSAGAMSYEAFARQLAGDRRHAPSANLRLGSQFEVIGLRTALNCEQAAR
jgi:hypothetical protein